MSHYIKVTTKFRDTKALLQSLQEQFPDAKVTHLSTPRALTGYQGRKGAVCSIIVSKASQDEIRNNHNIRAPIFGEMGFSIGADGTYEVHEDNSDAMRVQRLKLGSLPQRYATHVALNEAKRKGYQVQQTRAENGTVTLTLSKWS